MGRAEKKPATDTALALFENLTPDKVYTPGGVDAVLAKITDEVRKTIIDVSTEQGRKAANSLAYKVARSKTILDDMGKDLVADWKAKSAAVDAERKTIRDRLDVLKDEVKKPVDDWERAEADRVAAHINAITEIEDLGRFEGDPSSILIEGRIVQLKAMGFARDWQEFAEQADVVHKLTAKRLAALKDGAIKREADAAELEALRAEKAERERIEREQQEAAAVEQRAREAEEHRRRLEREATERAGQAARDAVEVERQRVAAQAEADRAAIAKRVANKRHRAKVITTAIDAMVTGCADVALTADQAKFVVEEIILGKIPNITISF